jgi:hypothetical protein
MNRARIIRRLAAILAGLAATLLAAPAAFARPAPPAGPAPAPAGPTPAPVHLPPLPPGWNKHPPLGHVTGAILGPNRAGYPPVSHIHTVVAGGMPGWQIVLIAIAAAVVAATAAVFLDRARAARRHQAAPGT